MQAARQVLEHSYRLLVPNLRSLQFGCCSKVSERKSVATDRLLITQVHMHTQNTHQPQRPHIRSPQPVYNVKRTERSAKASMAGVVTVIRQHHRGSCVFVIFCIHLCLLFSRLGQQFPSSQCTAGLKHTIPHAPILSFSLPSAMRENSPAKLSLQNCIERRAQFGRNTVFV